MPPAALAASFVQEAEVGAALLQVPTGLRVAENEGPVEYLDRRRVVEDAHDTAAVTLVAPGEFGPVGQLGFAATDDQADGLADCARGAQVGEHVDEFGVHIVALVGQEGIEFDDDLLALDVRGFAEADEVQGVGAEETEELSFGEFGRIEFQQPGQAAGAVMGRAHAGQGDETGDAGL